MGLTQVSSAVLGIVLFLRCLCVCRCTETEPQINFLSFNGSTLTVAENTTATLAFTVTRGVSPLALASVSIGTLSFSSNPHAFTPHCQILYKNGTCMKPRQEDCACDKATGRYELTTWVDRRRHNSHWAVRLGFVQGVESIERNFVMKILYAPQVGNLTIAVKESQPHFVEQGANVTLTCTWDPGNPPRTAAFLDERDMELPSEVITDEDSMHIKHVINDVRCEDSGVIHCEAASASVNQSATLLVQCAPSFLPGPEEFSPQSGEALTADFPMRAHTASVKGWAMLRLPLNNNHTPGLPGNRSHRHVLSIRGSPPSLTASLTLREVTSSDQGRWRLEVTNDVGTGHVDFLLTVDQTTTLHSIARVTTDMSSVVEVTGHATDVYQPTVSPGFGFVLLAIIACVLLLVIVLAVIFAVVLKKRGRRATDGPAESAADPEVHVDQGAVDISGRPRLPAPDVDPAAMVTSDNIYSEIDDDVVDMSGSVSGELAQPIIVPRSPSTSEGDSSSTEDLTDDLSLSFSVNTCAPRVQFFTLDRRPLPRAQQTGVLPPVPEVAHLSSLALDPLDTFPAVPGECLTTAVNTSALRNVCSLPDVRLASARKTWTRGVFPRTSDTGRAAQVRDDQLPIELSTIAKRRFRCAAPPVRDVYPGYKAATSRGSTQRSSFDGPPVFTGPPKKEPANTHRPRLHASARKTATRHVARDYTMSPGQRSTRRATPPRLYIPECPTDTLPWDIPPTRSKRFKTSVSVTAEPDPTPALASHGHSPCFACTGADSAWRGEGLPASSVRPLASPWGSASLEGAFTICSTTPFPSTPRSPTPGVGSSQSDADCCSPRWKSTPTGVPSTSVLQPSRSLMSAEYVQYDVPGCLKPRGAETTDCTSGAVPETAGLQPVLSRGQRQLTDTRSSAPYYLSPIASQWERENDDNQPD